MPQTPEGLIRQPPPTNPAEKAAMHVYRSTNLATKIYKFTLTLDRYYFPFCFAEYLTNVFALSMLYEEIGICIVSNKLVDWLID